MNNSQSLLITIFLLLVHIFGNMGLRAEETILLGNVINAGTGEAIENASVYFQGTKIGTSTDQDGFFYLRVDVIEPVKLVVSAVGYSRQTFRITPGESAGIEVSLTERGDMLQEVVALSSDAGAALLMARLKGEGRRNYKRRQEVQEDIEDKADVSTRYFISDIRARQLKSRFWQNMQSGMVMTQDSSYLLPLPENSYLSGIVPLPEHFDFYRSTIPFSTVSFISPLATSSNAFYRFYLMDSVVVSYNDHAEKHYRLHFLPRNCFDPLLEGVLEIDSTTAMLRSIDAHIPRSVNINYLNALQYKARYGDDGSLHDERLAALLETEIKADTTKIFPSLYGIRESVYSHDLLIPDTIIAADSSISAFLLSQAPKALPQLPSDSTLLAADDSLLNTPFYRFAKWAVELGFTGYIPTGTAVDIGQITDIIGYTPQEHLYMGLPFKTNQKMSRYISLGGWVGYGLRDRGVKYRAQIQALLPTERRHLISLTASDRYVYSDVNYFDALKHENSWNDLNLTFTSYILRNFFYNRTTAVNTAVRRQEVQLCFEDDWRGSKSKSPAVETTMSVQLGRQGYGNSALYHYYDMPSFRYASLRGVVRLGWGERTTDFFTIRKHYPSDLPTIYLGAEIGSYNIDKSQLSNTPANALLTNEGAWNSSAYHLYGRLNLMVKQDMPLGIAGRLQYLFEAGLVLGRVPHSMLSFMNGNQGYYYQQERFTLMNNMQYAADKYLLLHLDWNGRGVLFGRIPGVRYLHLHELAEMKIAYAGLSKKHIQLTDYAYSSSTLNIPYIEAGVGIGNILRVGDVYSVWRLTHRDDPSAALWAIRFRFRFSL